MRSTSEHPLRLGAPTLPVAASLVTLSAAAWQAWLLGRAARRGRRLAAGSVRYEDKPPRPRSRVLVLGDSTGVGVGADAAEASLAGLLAARFPHTEVVNHAFNGARLNELAAQAERLNCAGPRFDLALLLAGGNDVLHLTRRQCLLGDARRLLRRLRQLAHHTVWLGCADVGRSPALVPPLSWWFSRRTLRTMQSLAHEARAHGAVFVDFTHDPPGPLRFAADGVHPDSESYRRCFEVLLQRAPLAAMLRRRGR